jgi:hypothetical protein
MSTHTFQLPFMFNDIQAGNRPKREAWAASGSEGQNLHISGRLLANFLPIGIDRDQPRNICKKVT